MTTNTPRLFARVQPARRASTAVEFALVLPVLILLSFAIMDYGWYFITTQSVVTAAQDGARAGSQSDPEGEPAADAQARAQAIVAAQYPLNTMPVTVAGSMADDTVIVTVTLTFDPLVGFVPTPPTFAASAGRPLEQI